MAPLSSKVRRTVGPSERAPQTDIKLTNERSRVVDLGRGHHDAKDAPRVWPDALPLCRLPRARPNLTKPVTALTNLRADMRQTNLDGK